MTIRRLLLVMLGGAIGTAARLGIGEVVPDAAGLPLSILTANVVGALLIGVLAVRLPRSSDLRIFLGTGVLGGFTTYSAFAVGTLALWAQAPALAAAYVLLTLLLGFAAVAAGMRLGRRREERRA